MSNNSSNHQSQESTESDSEYSSKLNINLGALQKSASNVFHIQYTSIQEFSEGSFHKVYILKMEDSNKYIGRVAFPVYSQWKTEYEVAVIEYIHLNTHIPVSKVYYWNNSVNNLVETKYILIEYLPDIQLELKKLIFSKIGSIFFDSKNDQFKLGQDDGNDTFVLTHIDFYTSNILVKNDEITGVIDWECS
ncbi:5373_t:CDS:2, partial [Racocetra persica]